ncbi:RNA polymerase sigma factor [Paenibacillus cymbidii]|uniref:RNA polymerase sigma factor n=1 Tax=Paenibacillus cymbidii TaxID=1639034 RepID=UPI00107FF1F3|nr:RNA polymerase sigma factor [Paenibacillus cymbidii]
MELAPDEELVARVRQGDPDAFRQLVEKHQTFVYGIAQQVVQRRETAEDIAQEVFLRLYRTIAGYRGEARFTTWLYRIAANTAADYMRRQRRRPGTVLLDRVKEWLGDRREEPEAAVLRKERQVSVQELLARLPEKYRLVLYLYHYRQLSYEEIGAICGLPVKTVETRLYRGRSMLKTKWQEVHGDETPTPESAGAGPLFVPGSGDRGR